jgi:hypothetical protein
VTSLGESYREVAIKFRSHDPSMRGLGEKGEVVALNLYRLPLLSAAATSSLHKIRWVAGSSRETLSSRHPGRGRSLYPH